MIGLLRYSGRRCRSATLSLPVVQRVERIRRERRSNVGLGGCEPPQPKQTPENINVFRGFRFLKANRHIILGIIWESPEIQIWAVNGVALCWFGQLLEIGVNLAPQRAQARLDRCVRHPDGRYGGGITPIDRAGTCAETARPRMYGDRDRTVQEWPAAAGTPILVNIRR